MTAILEQAEQSEPWKALSWRFTAFFKKQTDIPSGARAFFDFFETGHEETLGKPAELVNFFRLLGPDRLSEVGLSPLKIDFKIDAVTKINVKVDPLKNAPDFNRGTCEESYDAFRRGVTRFMDSVVDSTVTRLAVGVELAKEVSSREEGYAVLGQRLISLRPDASISSDLSYRINYPRNKSFGGTEVLINRLSAWSTSKTVLGLQQKGMDNVTVEAYYARSLLDLNTSPTFDVSALAQAHRMELVDTLFDFALEIAQKGEIA